MLINNPKISIVLPNYNGVRYLERAINSFVQQNYPNKELVVVDGKSSDGSHDIIKRFLGQDLNVIWINVEDCGISDATNIGIERCSGDIIGHLGNDDLLYQNILEEVAYHSSIIEFDTIYFDSYTYYVKEKKCILRKCPDLEISKTNLLKYGTIVGGENFFIKRSVFNKYKYNVLNKYSMDYELYLDFSEDNYLHLYVPKVATINIFDGNISGSLALPQLSESIEVAVRYSKNWRDLLHIYTGRYSIKTKRQMLGHFFRTILRMLFDYKNFKGSVAHIVFAALLKRIAITLKMDEISG